MINFSDYYFCSDESILGEGAVDWVFTYQLLKRIGLPFNRWKAFKNGLIDDKGELLRDPTKQDRKDHWGYFDRVCWNIKKIISKFTGHSQLSASLVSLYLLKEGISTEKEDGIIIEIFGEEVTRESKLLSENEIKANYNLLKQELL